MANFDPGITSEYLKKYLDLDMPLLKEFKTAAPGTFKHSQNVMGICETIALEIDLDPIIMKVCALYHDIGKMFNPRVFSENQEDENNPISDMEPKVAFQVLSRHVSDGAMILINQTEMPREIISIITKHHGSTILRGVFVGKKKNGVDEELFRYKSPKPDCEYSSILMIVDSVEATARAMFNAGKLNTPKDRTGVIDDTIDRLSSDQQLDEMKVGILRRVKIILGRELSSIYQKRVPYTDADGETIGDFRNKEEGK